MGTGFVGSKDALVYFPRIVVPLEDIWRLIFGSGLQSDLENIWEGVLIHNLMIIRQSSIIGAYSILGLSICNRSNIEGSVNVGWSTGQGYPLLKSNKMMALCISVRRVRWLYQMSRGTWRQCEEIGTCLTLQPIALVDTVITNIWGMRDVELDKEPHIMQTCRMLFCWVLKWKVDQMPLWTLGVSSTVRNREKPIWLSYN